MARIIFPILMLGIILGINYYVFFRLWHIIPAGIFRAALVAAAIFLVFSIFLGLLGGFFLPAGVVSIFYKIGTSWFFILIYLLLIFLVLDALRLVLPMRGVLHENWLTLGILAVVLAAVFSYGYVRYHHKEKAEIALFIDKKTNPLKIVAMSDLHLGYGIGKAELDEWVELINRENPDIVLLAGDIKDSNAKPLFEQNMAASFRNIRSKYGIYACAGNHEYIGDTSQMPQMLDFCRQAGITLLRDTAVLVDGEFYVVGRDDRTNSKRLSIAELLAPLDTTKPIILLDHQPYFLDESEKNGVDLQISGHTHRGQIAPLSWVTDLMYEQSHGYLRKGKTHIYVSSGIGIWGGKFRIGTQSEYAVITFCSDSAR